jgi:ADP-ribose pyrophosphatase
VRIALTRLYASARTWLDRESIQSYGPRGRSHTPARGGIERIFRDTETTDGEHLRKTALHEGFLKVYRYEFDVERHAGGTQRITWELMERSHAVAVLGHDPKRDQVVLGNEFRPGALIAGEYPYREQLIAGAIEPSENLLEAAVREMQEEANLALRDPQLIHPGAYVSSGGT